MENAVPQKQCTGECKRILPATTEYFYAMKTGKYGVNSKCKECQKEYQKQYKQAHTETTKEYQKEYYQTHQKEHMKDYYQSHKEEMDARDKRYYYAHRNEVLARQKKYNQTRRQGTYYQTHKEKGLTNREEYYQANKEKIIADRKKYYQANKEKIQEYNQTHKEEKSAYDKQYGQTYPEKKRVTRHNRRAHMLGNGGSHTAQDIRNQYKNQKGKCYYMACGHAKLGKKYHIDHVIPLSRGGTNDPSNLVLTCPSCNLKKNKRFPHEWPEGGRLL